MPSDPGKPSVKSRPILGHSREQPYKSEMSPLCCRGHLVCISPFVGRTAGFIGVSSTLASRGGWVWVNDPQVPPKGCLVSSHGSSLGGLPGAGRYKAQKHVCVGVVAARQALAAERVPDRTHTNRALEHRPQHANDPEQSHLNNRDRDSEGAHLSISGRKSRVV